MDILAGGGGGALAIFGNFWGSLSKLTICFGVSIKTLGIIIIILRERGSGYCNNWG